MAALLLLDHLYWTVTEGRKIGAVKFSFRKTEVRQIIDPITGRVSNNYIKPQKTIKPRTRGGSGALPLFEILQNMPALSDSPNNKSLTEVAAKD